MKQYNLLLTTGFWAWAPCLPSYLQSTVSCQVSWYSWLIWYIFSLSLNDQSTNPERPILNDQSWTTNLERPILNDQSWTTNPERPILNDQSWTTNLEQPILNDQSWTTNLERPILNNQSWTTNLERPILNDLWMTYGQRLCGYVRWGLFWANRSVGQHVPLYAWRSSGRCKCHDEVVCTQIIIVPAICLCTSSTEKHLRNLVWSAVMYNVHRYSTDLTELHVHGYLQVMSTCDISCTIITRSGSKDD